jgi:uncharacterized membrane protein
MPSHSAHRSTPTTDDAAVRGRVVVTILVVVAAVVVLGLLLTWPGHHPVTRQSGQTVTGTVSATRQVDCGSGSSGCVTDVTVRITSGPDRGGTTTLTFTPGPTDPRLVVGDKIRMGRAAASGHVVYQFGDIARGRPLLLLAVLFAVVVVLVGHLRGLAALLGLGCAGVMLVVFVLPALLDGQSPTRVALLAGAAITLIVLPLSHGLSLRTGIAMLGTLSGMAVAAGIAGACVASLRITGLGGEENATLQLLGSRATVSGLLLAGTVIGALGVLNDVTVTQVSAVSELAGSGLSTRQLFQSAMRIGRDHIASTVYSLVLAYAGAALPLLLLFSLSGQSTLNVLTSDSLAPEIAASLIGGTALVVVVPLTTAIAAALLRPMNRPDPGASHPPETAMAQAH